MCANKANDRRIKGKIEKFYIFALAKSLGGMKRHRDSDKMYSI